MTFNVENRGGMEKVFTLTISMRDIAEVDAQIPGPHHWRNYLLEAPDGYVMSDVAQKLEQLAGFARALERCEDRWRALRQAVEEWRR